MGSKIIIGVVVVLVVIIGIGIYYFVDYNKPRNQISENSDEDIRIEYAGNVLTSTVFWNDIGSLVDKEVRIDGMVHWSASCTKINCYCCNDCGGNYYFANISEKILMIKGIYQGKNIGCGGNECNVMCYPLGVEKRYRVHGIIKEDLGAVSSERFYLELKSFENLSYNNDNIKSLKITEERRGCNDSDGGLNYSVKGIITSTSEVRNYIDGTMQRKNETFNDDCLAEDPGSPVFLTEYYCVGEFRRSKGYMCENGTVCKDGACVKESEEITCSDSDGGLNYYVKGITKTANLTKEDTCRGSAGCVDGVNGGACSSRTYLLEYYCENGVIKEKEFNCEEGYQCVDQGVCVKK